MPIKNKRIATCKGKNVGAESRAEEYLIAREIRKTGMDIIDSWSVQVYDIEGFYISHFSIFALFSPLSLLIRSFLIGLHPSVVFSPQSLLHASCINPQSANCIFPFGLCTLIYHIYSR